MSNKQKITNEEYFVKCKEIKSLHDLKYKFLDFKLEHPTKEEYYKLIECLKNIGVTFENKNWFPDYEELENNNIFLIPDWQKEGAWFGGWIKERDIGDLRYNYFRISMYSIAGMKN